MFIAKLRSLQKELINSDTLLVANALTYKLLLAVFPFLIFLISIVGFLEINPEHIVNNLQVYLPNEISRIIIGFVQDITVSSSTGLISTSLIIAVGSASTGFYTLIIGINKAYKQQETRSFFKVRVLSVLFVIVFALTIIVSLIMFIFRQRLLYLLHAYFVIPPSVELFYGALGYFLSLCFIMFAVMWMQKAAVAKDISFRSVIPGSIITVIAWIVASQAFNIYVNNFSNHSVAYGSIAGLMIMMIWLNIICLVLLLGSGINALLDNANPKSQHLTSNSNSFLKKLKNIFH